MTRQHAARASPFLLEACRRCLRVIDQLCEIPPERQGSEVQQLALTMAAVERLLHQHLQGLLQQVGADVSALDARLETAVQRTETVLPQLLRDRATALAPVGGMSSLIFHLNNTLSDVERALKHAGRRPSRWRKLTFHSLLALAVSAFGHVAFGRLWRRLATATATGQASRATRGAARVLFILALLRGYERAVAFNRRQQRLRRYNDQLSVTVRLWIMATALMSIGTMRRDRSYNTLIASPSVEDREENKLAARRVLESVPLPSANAFWYRRSWRLRLVKHGLAAAFAAVDAAERLSTPPGLMTPVSVALLPVFFALPRLANERTAARLTAPSPQFVKRVWGLGELPPLRWAAMAAVRLGGGVDAREVELGGVRCHVFSPLGQDNEKDQRVLFWCHGGGFLAGFISADAPLMARWCRELRCTVVYPHYRLCPEHPYPAGLDDLCAAYRAVLAERAPRRVVAGGDSAGGSLATGVVLRAVMGGWRLPDRLVLSYPTLNTHVAPSPSRAVHMHDPILPLGLLQMVAHAYVPDEATRATDPCVSPVYADDALLAQFPPTYAAVGGLDPLLDDAIDFDMRLRRLSVDGELQLYPALPHGFLYMPILKDAPVAVRQVTKWFGGGLEYV